MWLSLRLVDPAGAGGVESCNTGDVGCCTGSVGEDCCIGSEGWFVVSSAV